MRRYFGKKLLIYLLTFFVAVTIDWMIPRFMPGDPVQILISRAGLQGTAVNQMYTFYLQAFGLDIPIWKQYINFWIALFQGDLGVSIFLFPTPVKDVIMKAIPYDIALLIPAILAMYCAHAPAHLMTCLHLMVPRLVSTAFIFPDSTLSPLISVNL